VVAYAEPPIDYSGPAGAHIIAKATGGPKGVKYAGPIVYTNEKPPIIHFPKPPKVSLIISPEINFILRKPSVCLWVCKYVRIWTVCVSQGALSGGGWGKGGPNSIKYIPLPHHDLPILIYQSDFNPPIHVVSPPAGAHEGQSQTSYGPPQLSTGPSKVRVCPNPPTKCKMRKYICYEVAIILTCLKSMAL